VYYRVVTLSDVGPGETLALTPAGMPRTADSTGPDTPRIDPIVSADPPGLTRTTLGSRVNDTAALADFGKNDAVGASAW
jgi:hypothetical protein